MRRFWTLLLTPVLTLAFFMAGSPAANAFGAEVLGCSWGSGPWIANDCGGGDGLVTFSAHYLSGSYSYSWTLNRSVTIISGCNATSSTCTVDPPVLGLKPGLLRATLTLTQSGQSRTISAVAELDYNADCRTC
jgi:hypothetical protein